MSHHQRWSQLNPELHAIVHARREELCLIM